MSSDAGLDPKALNDEYEILGELCGRDDATCYLGRRKSDGRDVTIMTFRTPEGDAGSALAQLASDAHLLGSLTHPSVAPVIEGRWLGNDGYALVTDRVEAPTLAELISREERLPFQRAAAILEEINAVLGWARANGVVHRLVTPDTVHV